MLIENVSIPEGQIGDYRIEKKVIEENSLERVRYALNGRNYIPGTYTFLFYKNQLIMSDTPDEKMDHYQAVMKAKGNCLIVGLGIGMVLNAVAKKDIVKHITVIEISKEIIDLVAFHYEKLYPNKITFINADIFEWKPDKNAFYDMAWYDIWNDLCIDNLEEMTKLHRKLAKKTDWQGSWGKEYLLRRRKQYE